MSQAASAMASMITPRWKLRGSIATSPTATALGRRALGGSCMTPQTS